MNSNSASSPDARTSWIRVRENPNVERGIQKNKPLSFQKDKSSKEEITRRAREVHPNYKSTSLTYKAIQLHGNGNERPSPVFSLCQSIDLPDGGATTTIGERDRRGAAALQLRRRCTRRCVGCVDDALLKGRCGSGAYSTAV